MHQGHAADGFGSLRRFAAVGLQELEAGRRGEEEVLHLDLGAARQGGGLRLRHHAAFDRDGMRLAAALRPRGDGEAAHRADRRQRLAPEAEETDVDQVVVRKLRSGMALDRQRQIFWRHADAVVRHPDQRLAAAPERDINLGRAGIDGVLDQLLDDTRRALDHLARGDAVHRSF